MWLRQSHLLAPLTKLTSKTEKFVWIAKEQKAFELIKRIIARETLLSYPDYNKPFDIHTNASHYQLGAIISQGETSCLFQLKTKKFTKKLHHN